ncbi:MAG: 4Fe-4S dicluster domain-containing protein [bacterium]|nr:4Fe-4S dicluster domain-containing protein [bacterium]
MFLVDNTLCNGCGSCLAVCPFLSIILRNGKAYVMQDSCALCGTCVSNCPKGAIYTKGYPSSVGSGQDSRIEKA